MIDSKRFGHAGFRPIIYDGGPGLIRRQKRLIPIAPKDAPAILGAYEPEQCTPALETNANYFFLLFNQGFPDEEEKEDRAAFQRLAAYLREQGIYAVAGIAAGHHFEKSAPAEWFAVTPRRKRIPSWIPGFFMTCWSNPDWRAEVRSNVVAAMENGADGVCFDPLIFGAAPAAAGPFLIGPAGCACAKCKADFFKCANISSPNSNSSFPPDPARDPDAFHAYTAWRSGVIAAAVREWADAARGKNPEAVTTAALLHPAQVDAAAIFGADITKLSPVLDVIITETNNMINFEPEGLTYDSASLEIVREYRGGAAIASQPWPAGPHLDAPPPAQIFRAVMWEAATCGAAPAIRSSVFWDEATITPRTLLHDEYTAHRESASLFWNWIDRESEAYSGRAYAPVAILHSTGGAPRRGNIAAPRFFKIFQTLAELHIPTTVLAETRLDETDARGIRIIIAPDAESLSAGSRAALAGLSPKIRFLFIGEPPDWAPADNRATLPAEIFDEPIPRRLQNPLRRALLNRRHSGTPAAYYQHRFPSPGPVAKLLRKPGQYRIPSEWKTLYETVKKMYDKTRDAVTIEGPPYIHVREWRGESKSFFHIVNILPGFLGPSAVALRFPSTVSARIIMPDKNKIVYTQDRSIIIETANFAVVEIKNRS